MSGDVPHRDRRVKFTERSMELFGKWAEGASGDDLQAVSEALMRVVEGSWRDNYEHHEDLVHRLSWNVTITSDLMITIRFAAEYPTFVQLIAIGEPPTIFPPW